MRFLIFAGEQRTPGRGWNDFRSGADSVGMALQIAEAEAAKLRALTGLATWGQVVDTHAPMGRAIVHQVAA